MRFKKEYIAPLFSMAAIAVLLLFSSFALFGNTLAWFSSNKNTSAGGLSVTMRGVPETVQYLMLDGERVEATAENLFSDLTPGDTVTVQLYVENQSDSSISFELLMAAPVENQDEIPLIKDEKYHYFGSQIRINSVKNANTDVLRLVGNDRYLLTLDSELYIGEKKDLPPTSIDDKYDFLLISEKKLTNAISIPAGGNITLDIELQFVDNGISQNAYIGFGSADAFDENIENVAPPTLSRTLICYFAYEN